MSARDKELGKGEDEVRETHNFIGVHDGLKTVGNSDDRYILLQLGSQRLLNHRVRFVIDRGRR